MGFVIDGAEYRLEREFVLVQSEARALGEKLQRFGQALSEAEQLLLEWLLARAAVAVQPEVPEVGGYRYRPDLGFFLAGLAGPAASAGDGDDGVRAVAELALPDGAGGWALSVGKYVRISDRT